VGEGLGADEGSVDEEGELAGELIGAFDAEALGDEFEAAAELVFVGGGDAAGGVVLVGELGGDVELGAAAIVEAADAFADPGELGFEFGGGVGGVELGGAVPGVPEVSVFALEEGGDEVVLGAEVAIEAGLGDAGLLDDEVNADGADALLVEEGGCGLEDAVAEFRGG
jgi:hypothetical protein